MVIDKIQEFYLNGFIQVSLKKDNTWKKLIKELKSIQDDNLKPGFQLKSKYKGAMDLSPNVYDYSNVFLDLLKVNEIPELLFQLTQKTNICYHIQIRKTLFGGSSYLSKHRDSFIKKGEIIGNIPPPIKIIFYPNFDNRKSRKLSVNTGSHLRFFKSFYLDKLINFFSKNEIIESSNSSILILCCIIVFLKKII